MEAASPPPHPYLDQILLIDKPLEWTSFDVVKKVRNALKIKKVGHAGTLDPLATGLLIVCTGKKTKSINEIQAQTKEYTGTITIGHTTPSYDLETTPENPKDFQHISEAKLTEAAQKQLGNIRQTPPVFSAIKKDGVRAYELARKGIEVKMKEREVKVESFEVTAFELPQVHFRIVCSKGTYIRSMAHQFGEDLGTGAYLSALRRTKIGDYSLADAWQMDKLIGEIKTHRTTP